MYICYVDESGGFEAPNQAPGATPLMTFAGLIIRTEELAAVTADFLGVKRRFYPGLRTVRNTKTRTGAREAGSLSVTGWARGLQVSCSSRPRPSRGRGEQIKVAGDH
jgi:hypothetical protein